jgi:hypothetical protein
MVSDLLEFLWAVINNWAGYATGGLIVASAWLFFAAKDRQMPKNIALALAASFLFMAFFKAWKDKKDSAEVQRTENTRLQKQINDLSVTKVYGSIDFAILGAQPVGSHAALILTLGNNGAASAIDPGSWMLSVTASDGTVHYGMPTTILDKNLDFCFGGTQVRRFVRNDALDRKCLNPVSMNGIVQGFLWFGLPSLDASRLKSPKTTLTVSGKTVSGQDFKVLATVLELSDR